MASAGQTRATHTLTHSAARYSLLLLLLLIITPPPPHPLPLRHLSILVQIEALSPQQRPQPKKKQEARNFVTNPAKKGTGYGYAGVTLSSEIKYAPEPYDAAKEMENKARKQDKAKVKGKAFTVKTAKKGDVFDKNPYTYDGSMLRLLCGRKAPNVVS